jgi:hypothetical protein
VVQRAQREHFSAESRRGASVLDQEHLERHQPVEGAVSGLVDCAHTALPQHFEQFVLTKVARSHRIGRGIRLPAHGLDAGRRGTLRRQTAEFGCLTDGFQGVSASRAGSQMYRDLRLQVGGQLAPLKGRSVLSDQGQSEKAFGKPGLVPGAALLAGPLHDHLGHGGELQPSFRPGSTMTQGS